MIKDLLRKKYKEIRDSIENKKEKDSLIFNKLINLEVYRCAKVVGIYYSTQSEVDTIKLIEYSLSLGKVVCLPKVKEDLMDFFIIKSLDDLTIGSFNIMEPKNTKKIDKNEIDLMIVPGIVFDINNNRIGYGRGYYDKYLCGVKAYKIGLAYNEQIIEKIETGEHDIKLDMVITD